jgi:hypothetical protein
VSLRAQRGNADDALLRRLYGPRWHELLAAPAGRRRRHLAVVGCGALAVASASAARVARARTARARIPGRRATSARTLATTGAAIGAAVAGAGWLAGTAEFAADRRRAAPGSPLVPLVLTSALIPPLAIGHWLAGWWRHRHARPWS